MPAAVKPVAGAVEPSVIDPPATVLVDCHAQVPSPAPSSKYWTSEVPAVKVGEGVPVDEATKSFEPLVVPVYAQVAAVRVLAPPLQITPKVTAVEKGKMVKSHDPTVPPAVAARAVNVATDKAPEVTPHHTSTVANDPAVLVCAFRVSEVENAPVLVTD